MGVRQEQAREPLGSLSSVGEVYVDDSAAAAESTIFVGDKVHPGGNRLCGIYHDWKGALKISPKAK